MANLTYSSTTPTTEIRAIVELATAVAAPCTNPDPAGLSYTVVPEGWVLNRLPVEEFPRMHDTVRLRDAPSFIAYVNKHKTLDTELYAMIDPAKFVAVLNDVPPVLYRSAANGDDEVASAFRDWRCEFKVPPSREWTTWTGLDGHHMAQLDFARFLQDNLPDVVVPAGAELLELALNFETSNTGAFQSVQRLHDGSSTLNWRSETQAGALKVPDTIELHLPVFENTEAVGLFARLRYRVKDGALTLWFELVRPHKVVEGSFRRTWQRIAKDCDMPILLGSPE